MMKYLYRNILRYNKLIIALSIVLIIGALLSIENLKIENTGGRYDIPSDDPVMLEYKKFEKRFDSRETIYTAIEIDHEVCDDDIRNLETLTEELRKANFIEDVFSAVQLINFRKEYFSYVHSKSKEITASDLNSSLYGNFLSNDGKKFNVVIKLKRESFDGINSTRDDEGLISEIKKILEKHGFEKYHLIGKSLIDVSLDQSFQKDIRIFGSLSLIFVCIFLIILLRSWKLVVLALGCSLISLLITLGILSLTNTPLSMGLSIIIPLIPVLSIAYSIHYLHKYLLKDYRQPNSENIFDALYQSFTPNLLTGITTMFGFLSLALSQLVGISEVGIMLAIGVVISIFINNFLLLAILKFLNLEIKQANFRYDFSHLLAKRISNTIVDRGFLLFVIFGGLSCFAIFGLTNLKVDTNNIAYFKADNKIRIAYDYFDANFGGSLPFEIVIYNEDASLSQTIVLIDSLSGVFEDSLQISSFSVVDLIPPKEYKLFFDIDLRNNVIRMDTDYLINYWIEDSKENELLKEYLLKSDSSTIFRISSRLNADGSKNLKKKFTDIEKVVKKVLQDREYRLTGIIPVWIRTLDYVIESQIYSFGFAFLIVIIIMIGFVASISIGGLIIIANTFPVALVLGIMGYASIPIDISTVMIASIAIGVAVDDTIHFVYRFKNEIKTSNDTLSAIKFSFNKVGSALIITTIVFCGGFFILTFSNFLPVTYFGMLSGSTIVAALLGDLILLPLLLSKFYKKK